MQKYIDAVLTSSGTPAAGASVSVTVTATGLPATIYSDNGSTVISGSTVTTDASGEYAFYAANGRYTLTISYAGYVAEVRTDVLLFDPAESGFPAAPVSIANGGTGGTSIATAAANLQGTGLDSNSVGFRIVPQNSQSTNYVTVAADSGKHVYTASAITFTIAANSAVAYPVGTAITFVNTNASSITIGINTDTLTLAGTTTTGSRTLAQNGVATALKITSTSWLISGTGLT